MFKALAHAFSGPVNMDDADLERIGASAMGSRTVGHAQGTDAERQAVMVSLGKSLYAYKYSKRQDEYAPAVDYLQAFIRGKLQRMRAASALKLAHEAIAQWMDDACPACHGVGKMQLQEDLEGVQPMLDCQACNGTGARRHDPNGSMDEAMEIIHRAVNTMLETHVRMYGREG